MDKEHSAESVPGLIQCWGIAYDAGEDGYVNPSRVTYAPSEDHAVRRAQQFGGVAVTRLVTEWTTVTTPEGS